MALNIIITILIFVSVSSQLNRNFQIKKVSVIDGFEQCNSESVPFHDLDLFGLYAKEKNISEFHSKDQRKRTLQKLD